MRSLASLVLVLVFAFALVPAPTHARCRPSVGWRLRRVDRGMDVAPGAAVLFTLERVYAASEATALPATRVRVRRSACTAHCERRVPLRALAPNLFAADLPAAIGAGRYEIVETHEPLVVAASAHATTPTVAPVLAATPMTLARVGTTRTIPSIELAAPLPSDVSGVLLRWNGGTWFAPRTDFTSLYLATGVCDREIPGRAPIAVGDRIELQLMGSGGALGPTTTVTATLAVPGSMP
jgi:hypothetical protein